MDVYSNLRLAEEHKRRVELHDVYTKIWDNVVSSTESIMLEEARKGNPCACISTEATFVHEGVEYPVKEVVESAPVQEWAQANALSVRVNAVGVVVRWSSPMMNIVPC
jgi:hypothetical protein